MKDDMQSKCLRKAAYPTSAEAVARAEGVRNKTGGKVKPYLCRFCGMYHIGTVQPGDVPLPGRKPKPRKFKKKTKGMPRRPRHEPTSNSRWEEELA